MAEFKLDRFKYNWRDAWQAGQAYKKDDVVRLGGKSYVCLVPHVSSSIFRTDQEQTIPGTNPPIPQPRWTLMIKGKKFLSNWSTGLNYDLGDIVIYNKSLWICTVPHSSTEFIDDIANWGVYAQHINYTSDWATDTSYTLGSLVKYGGLIYKCIIAHVSTTLEEQLNNWEIFYQGIDVKLDWQPNTFYKVNDLVRYGAIIYRCKENHTSNPAFFEAEKFSEETYGFQFEGEWNANTTYNTGDIVRYGGFLYYAFTTNVSSPPYIEDSATFWILITPSLKFLGEWSLDTDYRTGDVVIRGGNLYVAIRDINSAGVDGSTLDYLDESTWILLVPGKSFKGVWRDFLSYQVGDIVYYEGSAYVCNFEHDASLRNYPGDNGNGVYYWDLLIQAGRRGPLNRIGDLVTFGPYRKISTDVETDQFVFDDSTFGDVALPLGGEREVLSVTEDLDLYWRSILEDADSVYVATNGTDDIGFGSEAFPFKTVQYAASYVEDTFEPGTPVVIRVSGGVFEEVLPIVIPAGCAINGAELRTTTIKPRGPVPEYQNDIEYTSQWISYFRTIAERIVTGTVITPLLGSTQPQTNLENNEEYPIAGAGGVNRTLSLIDAYKDYIEFRVASGTNDPSMSGSNTISSSTIFNAALGLELNKLFIAEQMFLYLKSIYPGVVFNELKIRRDVLSLLRGMARDLKYSGNYLTLVEAKKYVNAVNGSLLENMFLVRDTTGLRDLTIEGLQGTLSPAGTGDYRVPSGGACVSLDPGWGPDDQRTWIINRSPYIQGVTNIGTGCIGKKIDGSLHNGGNRSMVSNDFTQVLSDGIGIWVLNNGRTELVSVFTYYCYIGYYAEDGGVIRATNGNNSYGTYGAVSDGVDSTEIPQNVTINNRANEAIVSEAIAGGENDELFIFEYRNAGEQYTQATANIVGAGANAAVLYDDFRDRAVYEARLVSSGDSAPLGGAGYRTLQGDAQDTPNALTSLVLSALDRTQFLSDIEGKTVIITAGTGIGQYGYISGYNFSTKTITVRKQSTGELGWDHIIPGTPIVSEFDPTTRYRIEPQAIFSLPDFIESAGDLVSPEQYVDLEFGNTTTVYNDVGAVVRNIWLDDSDNVVSVQEVISPVAIQVNASISLTFVLPVKIQGVTSGAVATITAITANTGALVELDLTDGNGNDFVVGESLFLVFESGSDIDDVGSIAAVFQVTKAGPTYNVSITDGGAGYGVGDTIRIGGNVLGGDSPKNDLTITVTATSNDSTNAITAITSSGVGKTGRFVALTESGKTQYSDDGLIWTDVAPPFTGTYNKILIGNNEFVLLASDNEFNDGFVGSIGVSTDGENWSEVTLPVASNWIDGTYGDSKFVIVAPDSEITEDVELIGGTDYPNVDEPGTWTFTEGNTRISANYTTPAWFNAFNSAVPGQVIRFAYDGGNFTTEIVDVTTNGGGVTQFRIAQPVPVTDTPAAVFFLTITSSTTCYSSNGLSWTQAAIPSRNPADTVTPYTAPQWTEITYGKGIFVAVSGSDRRTAISTDGITWTVGDSSNLLPAQPLTGNGWNIVALAYGNNRFLALDSAGYSTYSFDGLTWYLGNESASDISWKEMKFKQGVFFAIGDEASVPTVQCDTTEDGILWRPNVLSTEQYWSAITFGRVDDESNKFVLLASNATSGALSHVITGARAKGRAVTGAGNLDYIKILDPGSGYVNPPTLTVIDPLATSLADFTVRYGNGVLPQPTFLNRGAGYRSSSSSITISGDGYADIYPTGNRLVVSGIRSIPGVGAQIIIDGFLNEDTEDDLTDLVVFSAAGVVDLGDDGSGQGTRVVEFLISPKLGPEFTIEHATPTIVREKFSQCRITGHDFLDIGTGNFEQTNYPEIYAGGNFFVASPENEVSETNNGRVFYTSTDQDGNFRVGELFSVQQATGIVTISAEFFELDGLSELSLGGVRLGGSGTVVNEFSTDPTMSADSNNVVPTQRAIATFLANRLSAGGQDVRINAFIAGRVFVGGDDNEISQQFDRYVKINANVDISGEFDLTDASNEVIGTLPVGITGTILTQFLAMKSQPESMQ